MGWIVQETHIYCRGNLEHMSTQQKQTLNLIELSSTINADRRTTGESRADDASLDRLISTMMVVDDSHVDSTSSSADDDDDDCRMQMLPMRVMMTMQLVISNQDRSTALPYLLPHDHHPIDRHHVHHRE